MGIMGVMGAANNHVKTFKVGGVYTTGPSDFTWTFQVVNRTAKTINIVDTLTGDARRVRVNISTFNGPREIVFPFGRFSMAPVLDAMAQV
jgi:hypothetical protein